MPRFRFQKRDIARISRDSAALLRIAIVAVVVALVVSFVLSDFAGKSEVRAKADSQTVAVDSEQRLLDLIRNPSLGGEEFTHRAIDSRYIRRGEERGLAAQIEKQIQDDSSLSPERKRLFLLLNEGLRGEDLDSVFDEIEGMDSGLRYRNEFLGDLLSQSRERRDEAISFYINEAEQFRESVYSRRSVLFELRRQHRVAELAEWYAKEDFKKSLYAHERISLLLHSRQLGKLLQELLAQSVSQLGSWHVVPVLFAALLWYVILSSFNRFSVRFAALSFLSFVLGAISAVITLLVVLIQEELQGFTYDSGSEPLQQMIYFVAGVGLREELIKLLCFVPIGLIVAKRKDPLEALILAGLVGLGFAFEENFQYVQTAPAKMVLWARFLTANALHISLTGYLGLYFYKMIARKGRGWDEFLLIFLVVIAAHGLYDALLVMPSLASYGPLATIFVALLAYRYFDPLRDCIQIDGLAKRISPLGVFVLGSVALVCGVLIWTSLFHGFRTAFGEFALTVGSLIPLCFAFVSRFRDV